MTNKVVILYNKVYDYSNPDETDVLQQVELVTEAFKQLGYNPLPVELGKNPFDDIMEVKKSNPLFVFNLVESVFDKGELLYIGPALLNALHLPFTGTPLEALFNTTSKIMAKRILQSHHIPTPAFFQVNAISGLEKGKQYIVKPVWEDGSVGLDEESVFTVEDTLKLKKINTLSPSHFFIEEYIDGREFNLSMLGGKNRVDVLQPAEMIFRDFPAGKPKMLGYKAKWDESSVEYKNTVRSFETLDINSALFHQLNKTSHSCWHIFNLKGYARVDFRLDKNDKPWVIEINGNPCISPDSGFIAAAHHSGYDNKTIIQRISEELN